MTKELMTQTLSLHGIEYADNGHYLNVKELWSFKGQAGFDWIPFYFEKWTMKDLLRWLGY